MTPPLSFWENIKHWLGLPRRVDARCFNCGHEGSVIDLGDDDFICDRCWHEWPYSSTGLNYNRIAKESR